MRQAFIAAVAALSLVLFGAAGPGFSQPVPEERKPAIVLAPPPGEAVEQKAAPVEVEAPNRPTPPIAKKKPTPPKKASAPQRAPQKPAAKKAPAKKAPAKRAPARAAASPAPKAKDCDYCYGCESTSSPICYRRWVCGTQYAQRFAVGLCRR